MGAQVTIFLLKKSICTLLTVVGLFSSARRRHHRVEEILNLHKDAFPSRVIYINKLLLLVNVFMRRKKEEIEKTIQSIIHTFKLIKPNNFKSIIIVNAGGYTGLG